MKPNRKRSKRNPTQKSDFDYNKDEDCIDDLTVEELYGYDNELEKYNKKARDCEREDCYD